MTRGVASLLGESDVWMGGESPSVDEAREGLGGRWSGGPTGSVVRRAGGGHRTVVGRVTPESLADLSGRRLREKDIWGSQSDNRPSHGKS